MMSQPVTPNLHQLTDEELMFKLKDGETRALELLMQRWQRPLYRHIYRMVFNDSLAEDIFQETFLRIYAHIQRYVQTAKFSTYAYKIATNLCINELKKRSRRQSVPLFEENLGNGEDDAVGVILPDLRDNPEQHLGRTQEIAAVQEALDMLPEHQRAVLTLSFYEGLPYEEIADILDCSVGTVKSRVHRGKKAIGEYLKRYGIS